MTKITKSGDIASTFEDWIHFGLISQIRKKCSIRDENGDKVGVKNVSTIKKSVCCITL